MKLAFSNSICPDLDLDTLIEKSMTLGYGGFELTWQDERTRLDLASVLGDGADRLRDKLERARQRIVALNVAVLDVLNNQAVELTTERVRRAIHLSAELGSPFVVISGPPLLPGANKARVLHCCVTVLRELVDHAADYSVTLAVENAGVFAQSADVWHIQDAVSSPALRVCLNPLHAELAGDPPSRAIKRLCALLAMVRLTSTAAFLETRTERFVEVDHSATNLAFLLEQLKGLAYRGWVCLDRPSTGLSSDDVPAADLLAHGARFLQGEVDRPVVELSAYKGDANTPRFATPPAC